jgi:hypothetical protein
MAISINCPKCKNHFELPDNSKGTERRCFRCGAMFKVEASAGAPAKAKPAAKPAPKTAEVSNEAISTGGVDRAGAKKYFIFAGVALALIVGGWFFLRPAPKEDPKKKDPSKESTQLGTTLDERLLLETRQKIRESRTKHGVISDPANYGHAVNSYAGILEQQRKIQGHGKPREGGGFSYDKKNFTDADDECQAELRLMEEKFKIYLAGAVEKASSLDDMVNLHTRPDLPVLKEFVTTAVMAKRPEWVMGQTITSLLNLVRQGRAQDASDAERNAFVYLLEKSEPEVKNLFVQAGDELFKLYAGNPDRAASMDAKLAKYLETVANDEIFYLLATSSVFKSRGSITVMGRSGPETVAAKEMHSLILRLWNKFGPTMDLQKHVNVVRGIVEKGNRESWGDLDPVILGGKRDPKYLAEFLVALIGAIPDQPGDESGKPRTIPYHKYLKQAIPGMTDEHIHQLLLSTRDWNPDCISAQAVVTALMETPTSKAVPGLIAFHRAPGSVKPLEIMAAIAKCHDDRDKMAVGRLDNAMNEWMSTDPNFRDVLQLFLKEGKPVPVAKVLINLFESGSSESTEKWFAMAGDILAKDPSLASAMVPALIRSFATYKRPSEVRKQLILKYKAAGALEDACQMYPRMTDPPTEFEAILRGLLDNRAVKFLRWCAFKWSKRPAWAIEELRRVTGDQGPMDAKYWEAWIERNGSKLPPQVEGFEVSEDKEPPK